MDPANKEVRYMVVRADDGVTGVVEGAGDGGSARPVCPVHVLDRTLFQDPHPEYARLRAEAPVSWDEEVPIWVVAKHADVSNVSLHADLFCSGKGIRPRQSVDLSLVSLDGERHVTQRRLINQGFSPRMIRLMEPRVREVVTQTLDAIAGRGACDFVADIAVPIPLVVIAELMGLPVEDRERFWHWSDRMMGGDGREDDDDPMLLDAAAAFGEYVEYLSTIIDERRAAYRAAKAANGGGKTDPAGDDLISVLVAAAEESVLVSDEELTKDELTMFLVVAVIAGNETTRNAISGGMLAFSRFPGEWKKLVAEPSLAAPAADEVVRYVTPVISFARTATRDTELGGQSIAEDEKILLLYQSANRDEDVFDDPDTFRIDRTPNPHLGFGVGPHVCLGINLAKLEIRVVLEELARRFPDMAVVPGTEVHYGDSTLVHSLETLPVTYTPETI
jgi:cytochrome P450